MGRLDERVASHPVHQVLEDTRASLDALTDEQRAAMDETGPEGMPDRVVALREFISGLLVSADPRFVAVGMLDGIQNSVAQVRDQLDNVRTVGAQHTPNVDEAIDAALGQAWPLAALVRIDPANAEEAGRQIGA